MYLLHASKNLDLWTRCIVDTRLQVASVHTIVVEQAPAHKVLPLLLVAPTPLEMHSTCKLTLPGTDEDAQAFDFEVHNKIPKLLNFFISQVDLATMRLPKVLKVGEGGTEVEADMPTDFALLYLSMVCVVHNICRAASAVHEVLLLPASEGKDFNVDDIFGFSTYCVRQLHGGLSDLDLKVSGEAAVRLEVDGWRLPLPFGLIREWRHSMSLLAGKIERCLLQTFVNILDGVVIVAARASRVGKLAWMSRTASTKASCAS